MILRVNGYDIGRHRGEEESDGEKCGQGVQVVFERVAEKSMVNSSLFACDLRCQ